MLVLNSKIVKERRIAGYQCQPLIETEETRQLQRQDQINQKPQIGVQLGVVLFLDNHNA